MNGNGREGVTRLLETTRGRGPCEISTTARNIDRYSNSNDPYFIRNDWQIPIATSCWAL